MTAFPRIDRVPYVVIDTETTGLSWWKDRVFGISIALPGGDSLYWDIRTDPQVIQWLNDLAKGDRVGVWVGHNLKFDYHFLREAGFEMPRDKIDCTMVRGALINEHEPSYSLDFLARKYAKQQKDEEIYEEMAKLFGGRPTRSAQMPNISRAPVHVVAKYAKQDVIATQALYEWQQGEIERQGLHKVHGFERRLMPVIIDMETEGVEVDVELAEKAVRGLTERIDTMQGDLNTLAGFEVNPNPSGSITDLFKPTLGDDNEWYLIDGTKADKTEGGKASINAECLRRMKHPAAKMILDLRKMLKTRDTFLSGHILGHQHDGIIHCNYNQTKNDSEAGTGTGRLSITNPALQQIPSRDVAIKSLVRPIFKADLGAKWLGMDWSQFEFRVANHYGQVPAILKAYHDNPNLDFHQLVSDMTGIPRNAQYAGGPSSKAINLGLAFNMGSGRLAQECGLPYTEEEGPNGNVYLKAGPEAMALFEKYHAANPGMRNTAQKASSIAKERGYVHSAMGRHIRFPGGQFVHKASGLIYQATSADCMKQKLIELDAYLKEHQCGRLLLTVHDEVGISLDNDSVHHAEEIARIYTTFDGRECPIALRVPITCDWGLGDNWLEAKG
jgi:DNA polymerase I-like protein with 3'-5' exonuclease and polymerase domains